MRLEDMRGWYMFAALQNPGNRIAFGVTTCVALAVLAFARIPLAAGFDVELGAPERFDGLRQVSYVGFSQPAHGARAPDPAGARVVFNRPLPRRFVLEIEASALELPAVPVQVQVAGRSHRLLFGPASSVGRIAVDNETGARSIAIGWPRRPELMRHLRIGRVGIRPARAALPADRS